LIFPSQGVFGFCGYKSFGFNCCLRSFLFKSFNFSFVWVHCLHSLMFGSGLLLMHVLPSHDVWRSGSRRLLARIVDDDGYTPTLVCDRTKEMVCVRYWRLGDGESKLLFVVCGSQGFISRFKEDGSKGHTGSVYGKCDDLDDMILDDFVTLYQHVLETSMFEVGTGDQEAVNIPL
jgi:hypothetical protein